jgi:oligopeptide/dipeptide ABC transporter ATP-binding protein
VSTPIPNPAPSAPTGDGSAPLLSVRNLVKEFPIRSSGLIRKQVGVVQAVSDISFDIAAGETLGLVGESGCGKSTTSRAVLHLQPATSGQVFFNGVELTTISKTELRRLRRDMQLVFQDPFASLDPRITVNEIIAEPLRIHGLYGEKAAGQRKVSDLMETVGLKPEHGNRYPHEFSGGQRQRIGIARALALRPKLIVADEPVSALDVSIQAQVVNLLEDLQNELNLAYVFIAHDLSVVRHISDRVAVMYLGKIVEIADQADLYTRPHHPYTTALMSAVPIPDPDRKEGKGEGQRERIRLVGDVPSPINPPKGCRFNTRCWKAQDICRTEEPLLLQIGGTSDAGSAHQAACHFPENV